MVEALADNRQEPLSMQLLSCEVFETMAPVRIHLLSNEVPEISPGLLFLLLGRGLVATPLNWYGFPAPVGTRKGHRPVHAGLTCHHHCLAFRLWLGLSQSHIRLSFPIQQSSAQGVAAAACQHTAQLPWHSEGLCRAWSLECGLHQPHLQ